MFERFKELAGLQDLEPKHLYLLLGAGAIGTMAVIGFSVRYFSGDFAREDAEKAWRVSVSKMCECKDIECFGSERIFLNGALRRAGEVIRTPDTIDDQDRAIRCLDDLCLDTLSQGFMASPEGEELAALVKLNHQCIMNRKQLEIQDGHREIAFDKLLLLRNVPYPGLD